MEPDRGRDSEPLLVVSRRTARRLALVALAVIVVAGVGVGAYLAGRSSVSPPERRTSTRGHLGTTTTTAPQLKTFLVPSTSMYPTIKGGDSVSVDLAAYAVTPPERGDVVVFKPPAAEKGKCGGTAAPDLVKRVVGLPGESISAKGGHVYITGGVLPQPWLPKTWSIYTANFGPVHIPKGEFFVMGDNRVDSCDSRIWGPVTRSAIVGKVVKVIQGRTTSTTTSSSTTSTTVPPPATTTAPVPLAGFTTLAPATVPPVSAECNVPVTVSADGNWSPQLCSDGGVNVAAWVNYERIGSPVLALGPDVSESYVVATMCQTRAQTHDTYPEIENVAKLAGAYYGWAFASTKALTLFPFYPTFTSNECG